MDPLSLLRQATMTESPVEQVYGHFVFGTHRLHESTETAFKRTLKSGGHYQLKDIIFYLSHVDLGEAEYRKKCLENKVTAVVVQDKQALKQYLTGQIETCDQIDKEFLKSTGLSDKQSATDAVEQASGSKRKIPQHEGTETMSALEADRLILKELRKDDVAFATSQSVLCKAGVDLSFAMKLFNDRVLCPAHMRGSLASTPLSATKRAYATPIIILPSAVTSLLTMANAARFLDHGVYVPIDAKAAAASTLKDVMIQHKHNNVMCEFRLVDSAARLNERPEYWERVVAVFATGQPWQFSGFKWSEPVDLFQHVLGVHVMFADSEVNANIQSWNCRVLKISRTQRELDNIVMNQFWKMLHSYIELNKPWLVKADKTSGK